ncbi:hypothetical protein ABPG77_001763 [Micractinium sp. CCAP 211/92]
MAAPDWSALLNDVFRAKGDPYTLKESKAVKLALKKAVKHSAQTKEHLAASLKAFLVGGQDGFRLQDGKVVKATPQPQEPVAKSKKKSKEQTAVPLVVAQPAPSAAVAAAPVQKEKDKKTKQKKRKGEQVGDAAEGEQAAPQAETASRDAAAKKKGKGKKRQAEAAAEQAEPERGQQHAAPPAAAEQQQQQQPAAKRRKQPASGSASAAGPAASGVWAALAAGAPIATPAAAAAAPAAPAPAPAAESEEDVAEVRWRDNERRQNVKSGVYSKAEKETLRQAVINFAAKNGLPTDSFDWLFGSSRSGATKGAWKKIAAALPHRTFKSVWAAGTRMLHEGNYQGRWTPEEDAQLLALVSERGRKWKEIGGAVGRMAESCRDRWLMIRQGEAKKEGPWSDEETEQLRQAVQEYLAAKTAAEGGATGSQGEDAATLTLEDIQGAASEPVVDADGAATVTVSRRIILDDIDWNVVSQAVGTRSNIQCLEKWYSQLSPSMVARGEWGSGDDRRLLRALFLSGAVHDYEVDWNQVVRGRTAQQAKRRWRLMVKSIPDSRDLEFGELVEALVDRHLPQLREQQQQQQQQQGGGSE